MTSPFANIPLQMSHFLCSANSYEDVKAHTKGSLFWDASSAIPGRAGGSIRSGQPLHPSSLRSPSVLAPAWCWGLDMTHGAWPVSSGVHVTTWPLVPPPWGGLRHQAQGVRGPRAQGLTRAHPLALLRPGRRSTPTCLGTTKWSTFLRDVPRSQEERKGSLHRRPRGAWPSAGSGPTAGGPARTHPGASPGGSACAPRRYTAARSTSTPSSRG